MEILRYLIAILLVGCGGSEKQRASPHGFDFLGAAKYGEVLEDHYPNGHSIGVLMETFGDPIPTLKKLLDKYDIPFVRIHLVWRPDHSYNETSLLIARNRLLELQSLFYLYPGTSFLISPFLEHTLTSKEVLRPYTQLIHLLPPNARLVNTPCCGGEFVKGMINEFHGDHYSPTGECIYSQDGIKASSLRETDCFLQFCWRPEYNLRRYLSDDKIPPKERNSKIFTKDMLTPCW